MPTYCNELVVDGQVKFSLKVDTVTDPSHIMAGYYGHLADGRRVLGTGQSGPSATQHTIVFVFEDDTSTTLTGYWDATYVSDAITATTPTEYGGKTVSSASLDGMVWYETSGDIPLNTELVDYTAVRTGLYLDDHGTITTGEAWDCITDYIPIDPAMTFSFKSRAWYGIGFFDSSKNLVVGYVANDLGTASGEVVTGTITPSVIPSNAAYVVLTGNPYQLTASALSLIRTV